MKRERSKDNDQNFSSNIMSSAVLDTSEVLKIKSSAPNLPLTLSVLDRSPQHERQHRAHKSKGYVHVRQATNKTMHHAHVVFMASLITSMSRKNIVVSTWAPLYYVIMIGTWIFLLAIRYVTLFVRRLCFNTNAKKCISFRLTWLHIEYLEIYLFKPILNYLLSKIIDEIFFKGWKRTKSRDKFTANFWWQTIQY